MSKFSRRYFASTSFGDIAPDSVRVIFKADSTLQASRDIHDWEAHFDFSQTATGNWTFRFEVSLLDNRDLKFDNLVRDRETGESRSWGFHRSPSRR